MTEAQITALIAAVLLAGKYNDEYTGAVADAIEIMAHAQLRLDEMAHARIKSMREEAASFRAVGFDAEHDE